jgi:predicted anti-sigma-YlaC factor YlaD
MPQRWVDEHLDECARCRGWAEAAAEVTRRARLAPAELAPDVTGAVLDRLPLRDRSRRRAGWRGTDGRHGAETGIRWLLSGVGAGQLALGLSALDPGGHGMGMDMGMPVHLTHETSAWNLALAACFVAVAALPRLAAGALPFLLSFTVLLGSVTIHDLRAGHVPADRAVDHLLLLVGAVLVGSLAYLHRSPGSGPVGALVHRWTSRLRSSRRRAAARPAPAAPDLRSGEDPATASGRAA